MLAWRSACCSALASICTELGLGRVQDWVKFIFWRLWLHHIPRSHLIIAKKLLSVALVWLLFCFKLTANLRSLFCSHGERLELNEETKTGGDRKFFGLKCLSQRRRLSAIFSLVRGMDWLFPLLDVHSWDHFVLACREGLMKELLKLLSDVFCESLQDYINLD